MDKVKILGYINRTRIWASFVLNMAYGVKAHQRIFNRYSYSKLETYEKCPFQFLLKYVWGHYSKAEAIALEVGTAIHACEEKIANYIIAGESIPYTQLKNELVLKMAEWEHKFPKTYSEPDKSGRIYSEKLYYYMDQEIYRLEEYMKAHPTYEITGVEQEFRFTYKSGQKIHGFIDRVFHDKATDTYIIQDIKTYNVPVDRRKLVTPLQFVVYTLAVEELYKCGEDQIRCQYYLPFCDLTQDAGKPGFMKKGMEQMDKLFSRIKQHDFEPQCSPLCSWCPFCQKTDNALEDEKYLCPYFSKWNKDTRLEEDRFRPVNKWQGLENHEQVMEEYLKQVKEAR